METIGNETGTGIEIGKDAGIKEVTMTGVVEPGTMVIVQKKGPEKVEQPKTGSRVIARRKLKKIEPKDDGVQKKEDLVKKAKVEEINLEVSPLKGKEAPEIHFKFSFPKMLIPGLREEKEDTDPYSYMKQRVEEVKQSGLNPDLIEESRLGIRDNGLPMGKYEFCQAGIDLFYLLLAGEYKMVDAYRKIEKKAHGRKLGEARHIIYVVFSKKGDSMRLDKETFSSLKAVMKKTMTAYLWDNRRLPQNTIMVNFPFEHLNLKNLSEKVPYTQKLVIKL